MLCLCWSPPVWLFVVWLVCLFICKITQKPWEGLSRNLVEWYNMGQWGTHYILVLSRSESGSRAIFLAGSEDEDRSKCPHSVHTDTHTHTHTHRERENPVKGQSCYKAALSQSTDILVVGRWFSKCLFSFFPSVFKCWSRLHKWPRNRRCTEWILKSFSIFLRRWGFTWAKTNLPGLDLKAHFPITAQYSTDTILSLW